MTLSTIRQLRSVFLALALSLLSCTLLGFFPAEATAQEPGETCIVLVDANSPMVDALRSELEATTSCAFLPADDLKDLTESDSGLNELGDQPEQLKALANANRIELFVLFDDDGWDLFVEVYSSEGRQLGKSRLDSASSKVSQAHLPLIASAAREHLPKPKPAAPTPETETVSRPEPVKRTDSTTSLASSNDSATVSQSTTLAGSDEHRTDDPWLTFRAGFSLRKRVLVLSSISQRSSSLRTPLYPAYALGARAFPLAENDILGFGIGFEHAFDNVTFARADENIDAGVNQLAAHAQVLYRVRDYDEFAYRGGSQSTLHAGVGWQRYGIERELRTPLSTEHLWVELGFAIVQGLYRDLVGLSWNVVIEPWVADLSGNDLGSQDWGLGAAMSFDVGIQVWDDTYASAGWGVQARHNWYSGTGFNNFEDISSMIFEHAPSLAFEYGW